MNIKFHSSVMVTAVVVVFSRQSIVTLVAQTDTQIHGQTDRQSEREREIETDRDRESERVEREKER